MSAPNTAMPRDPLRETTFDDTTTWVLSIASVSEGTPPLTAMPSSPVWSTRQAWTTPRFTRDRWMPSMCVS